MFNTHVIFKIVSYLSSNVPSVVKSDESKHSQLDIVAPYDSYFQPDKVVLVKAMSPRVLSFHAESWKTDGQLHAPENGKKKKKKKKRLHLDLVWVPKIACVLR